ncbi:GNAT family N-acetyltransferase [Alterisphingorhabdus coralli]|uniref:GNAT family N-acetyltransferase n=1 Tax=Alterisphingorhabdus coralli TaxID=3071408 RepID=A0AA97HYV5_9SPHN|nr:GNAT family N-acetyltransferase [Parasphingorhabdus sp. SCSIO 66989]WOE73909.1 GNAT family N-acetyltransferase [Parasphingorhabdus sp. SCSIO 66989]
MIIRPLKDDDRSVIADIHALSWQQSYRQQMPADFLDNELPDIMRKRWRDAEIKDKDIVLVAEEDGNIAGFVAAWDGEPVYLDNLHVLKKHRSSGIGRQLMGATARQAVENGREGIELHVVIGNDRAKALYLAMGGEIMAEEDKVLTGITVPHYRIGWADCGTLIARTGI